MKFLSLIILFVSHAVLAGGSIAGNGGDVVTCPAETGQPSIQMLDYYEYFFIEQQRVQFGDPSEDFQWKVSHVLDWLDIYSPFRAALYRSRFNIFLANTTFVNQDLVDIPDSLHFVMPTGCRIQQLAIQEHTKTPILYTIDQRLWSQLDEITKAGLVLHELIYGEALDYGQINSINARDFHRFLMKPKFGDPRSLLEDELKNIGFSNLTSEVIFKNGDAVKFLNSRDQYNQVCGYKVNGVVVDACTDPKVQYIVESYPNPSDFGLGNEILSVRDSDGHVLYHVSGDSLGFPFDVLAIHPDYVETLEDVYIKNSNFEIWCSGKIFLNQNFTAED